LTAFGLSAADAYSSECQVIIVLPTKFH
jgi:hypothetical protein